MAEWLVMAGWLGRARRAREEGEGGHGPEGSGGESTMMRTRSSTRLKRGTVEEQKEEVRRRLNPILISSAC